jgi:malate/lactate dehydrogenase
MVKVSIVGGAGAVGSALAYTLMTSRRSYEIVLMGRRLKAIECQFMDLQALSTVSPSRLRQGSLDDFSDSNVIVITASVPFDPNRATRAESLGDNAEIVHPYFSAIARLPAEWPGRVIIVTNPIDVFTSWLQQHAKFKRLHILGYAWNDCLRLRTTIAKTVAADARKVEAWVIGEHGDAFVPLFDRVRINGRKWQLTSEERAHVLDEMRTWYARWCDLGIARTTSWTTAAGVNAMIENLVHYDRWSRRGKWSASVPLSGEYGLRDISVGVPVARKHEDISVLEWSLGEQETAALHGAAEVVRQRVRSLGRI